MGIEVDLFLERPHKDLVCGVCGDIMEEAMETECGHVFCAECLSTWFLKSSPKTCPFCRSALVHMRTARGSTLANHF